MFDRLCEHVHPRIFRGYANCTSQYQSSEYITDAHIERISCMLVYAACSLNTHGFAMIFRARTNGSVTEDSGFWFPSATRSENHEGGVCARYLCEGRVSKG